jgi:hypothetical protein
MTGENRRTQKKKTCPSATLSIKNPTQINVGAKQGIQGEKPVSLAWSFLYITKMVSIG